MSRMHIFAVPNFNVAVRSAAVAGLGTASLPPPGPGVPTTPPPNAAKVCTGGDFRCPQDWTPVPISVPACLPNLPCPTYNEPCQAPVRVAPNRPVYDAKRAIQYEVDRFRAGLPVTQDVTQGHQLPGTPFDFSPYDRGHETCEWQCPPDKYVNFDPKLSLPRQFGSEPVPVCTTTPPAPVNAQRKTTTPASGSMLTSVALVAAGLAAVAVVSAVAVYATRSSARPNRHRRNGPEWWIEHSPEAALIAIPPAIPSYLAYKYAIKRMRPETAETIEGWRAFVPTEEEDEWDDE